MTFSPIELSWEAMSRPLRTKHPIFSLCSSVDDILLSRFLTMYF